MNKLQVLSPNSDGTLWVELAVESRYPHLFRQ
jgi:hypothetical protein